jgi:hypothetical protein
MTVDCTLGVSIPSHHAGDFAGDPHAASGWRIHCGVEVTELSTNKQHTLSHHVGDFAGEQNSLHAFVVKRENSEKGFPYLLGTQLLGRAVGVENFHHIGERGPEILEATIKDVFKRVVVVLIQYRPGIFFSVIYCKVGLGYKSAGEGAARENPLKLDAEVTL